MTEEQDSISAALAGPHPANPRAARILDAASLCFSQKGFQNTTIIDVADAAGVSRPLVYKYFGDKDGLIDSVLRATFADWQRLNERPSRAEESGPADRDPGPESVPVSDIADAASALERKFERALDFVRDRPIFRSILGQDPQIVMRGHLEALRQCRAVSADHTRAILRAGITSHEFRSDLDEDATTASLEMVLFGLLERALGIRPELTTTPSLVRTTIDLLLTGLRSEGSRP